jgi:uncharacterized protein (TIGR03435 family)
MRVASHTFVLIAFCCKLHGQTNVALSSFEVASVKLSPPLDRSKAPLFGCSGGPETSDPELYVCHYATLQTLILEAFSLQPFQLPYVPDGDHSTYEVVAKAPPERTREQFKTMLQNLLAERLRLISHFEKKDSQVYDLVVAKGKPKLTPVSQSQPATKAADEYGFPQPSPGLSGTYMQFKNGIAHWVARNVSVDQIARMLTMRLGKPVTNVTGIEGKYEFTINLSAASVGGPEGPPRKGPDTSRPDDADLPTVFAVLQNELGLKLEPKKGSFELFVIDHAEKVPVEQ